MMRRRIFSGVIAVCLCVIVLGQAQGQRSGWRQATDAELTALLPARAPVEKEHIETEMRTASGIVNAHGHYIAGVVLLTAGYSADGKYSHYLLVQAPIKVGGRNCVEARRVCVRVDARARWRHVERALSRGWDGSAGGHDGRTSDCGVESRGELAHLAAE